MLELAGIFGNGMVFQCDRINTIWGTEDGSDEVCAVFENEEYKAEVKDGCFEIALPAHEAATGLSIEIKGSATILLTDVCFGDVFYLAGQSNMELPVSRTLDVSKEDVDASDYPYIRQYRVTPQYCMREDKKASLPKNPWTKAIPGQIGEMSAAGFYCAKRIYDKKKIPLGLVLGAQGGSTIESWMPASLLSEFGDYSSKLDPFMEEGALQKYLQERDAEISSWRGSLEQEDETALVNDIPEGAEDFTVPGMLHDIGKEHRGVVWFYKDFSLGKAPEGEAFLYCGDLIDADRTYINGHLVGKTEYRYPPRKYTFSSAFLKEGKNRITVRLIVENGDGGFVAEHPYFLKTKEEQVDLEGDWKIFFGATNDVVMTHTTLGQEVPTGLYKASVLPLKDYSFRGIWWYQGESNSDDPSRYDEKFKAMIENWRSLYKQELPLICIEMCDYQDPITGEQPDGWAKIQEMQRGAAQDVERCDVVSAKDLFTPLELHPQRKSELGARMAEAAMTLYFGEE